MQFIHKYGTQESLNCALVTGIPNDLGTLPGIIFVKDEWLARVIIYRRYYEGLKPIRIIIVEK